MPQYPPFSHSSGASTSSTSITIHLEQFLLRLAFSTRQAYLTDLESFCVWLGQPSIVAGMTTVLTGGSTWASDTLARFVDDHRDGQTFTPAVRRRLSAVNSWLRYAVDAGLITWRVNAPPLLTPCPVRAPVLDVAAVQAILQAVAVGDLARQARDAAIIIMLFVLGLRTGEVVALDLADIQERRQTINIRHGHRGTWAELRLPDSAWQVLAQWLVHRTHHPGPLFVRLLPGGYPVWPGRLSTRGLRRMVTEWSKRAGLTANPREVRRAGIVTASDRPQAVRRVLAFARLDALPAVTVGGPAVSGLSVADDLMGHLWGAQTGTDDDVLR